MPLLGGNSTIQDTSRGLRLPRRTKSQWTLGSTASPHPKRRSTDCSIRDVFVVSPWLPNTKCLTGDQSHLLHFKIGDRGVELKRYAAVRPRCLEFHDHRLIWIDSAHAWRLGRHLVIADTSRRLVRSSCRVTSSDLRSSSRSARSRLRRARRWLFVRLGVSDLR